MADMPGPFRISREVYVPQFENGFLHYTIMEIIVGNDSDGGWVIRLPPTQIFPTATGPTAVTLVALEGINTPKAVVVKNGLQSTSIGGSWTVNENHLG